MPATAAPPTITPADAAHIYRRSIGHIYVLARRHRWRRITVHGRTHYHLAEVDATLGERADLTQTTPL